MMGRKSIAAVASLFLLTVLVATADSQGAARGRIEAPRDPALEVQAKHNLDVARWYFEKRKAYEGARDRLQEIIDAYPDFSRMDEVVFLLGEIHIKLSKNDKAAEYFNKLLKDYPTSEFAKKAQARLDELKSNSK